MEVKGPGGAWDGGAAFNDVACPVLRVQGAEVHQLQKDLELYGSWQLTAAAAWLATALSKGSARPDILLEFY